MRRLGRILHANKGNLIARAEHVPKLGIKVHDQRKKSIGRVSDIFGPTDAPYIAIKPVSNLNPRDLSSLINKEVYY